jgi:hypothetical protein
MSAASDDQPWKKHISDFLLYQFCDPFLLQHLVAALKTVPGHEWDPTRKSVPQHKLVFGFGQFLAWFLFTACILKKLG